MFPHGDGAHANEVGHGVDHGSGLRVQRLWELEGAVSELLQELSEYPGEEVVEVFRVLVGDHGEVGEETGRERGLVEVDVLRVAAGSLVLGLEEHGHVRGRLLAAHDARGVHHALNLDDVSEDEGLVFLELAFFFRLQVRLQF